MSTATARTARPLVGRNGRPLDVELHVGHYGVTYRPGVLTEHVDAFIAAGGRIRPAASGSGLLWAVLPSGAVAPVVCSELVWIDTEDGRIDGRCGFNAGADGRCARHA